MTNTNQVEFKINPMTSEQDVNIINQSIENFKTVEVWNDLTTDIIGKQVGIGFSTFVIVGLNKATKKAKLVIQHVEELDLYEVSFKTVKCDLKLQGFATL